MIHIDLDWDERDVLAAISLLGLLIAETGKDKDSVSGFDELARAAHWMADAFQKFDCRYKRRQYLMRQRLRDEITAEEYKAALEKEDEHDMEMDRQRYE